MKNLDSDGDKGKPEVAAIDNDLIQDNILEVQPWEDKGIVVVDDSEPQNTVEDVFDEDD